MVSLFLRHLRLPASPPLRLFLLFLLWSLLLTYPLPLHLFSHIPRGSEEAVTVPLFNLWTLRWNIDQLMQGYPRYWEASIFAPDSGTFAFSESQPLSALLAAPLWLAFQAPALGYNVVVLLCLTLNGWFACGLLRSWGLPPLPALLAGLLVQSLPFVAQEMGVLQLVALFGFLWSLFYLSRLFAHLPGSLKLPGRWAIVLGLALGPPVMFFTCAYYGLFSLIFLPLAGLLQLRRDHLNLKTGGRLLAAGVLALGLTAPLLWAQQQRLEVYHFTRSAETIEANSAKLAYYGDFLDYNILYAQLFGLKSGQGQRLFPGLGLLILAILGLLDGGSKRVKLYCVVAALLALLLSLGLRLDVGGWLPYQWVREYVPGFAQLRSPFRLAALVQLHLALLAGFGLHNLGRWFVSLPNLPQPEGVEPHRRAGTEKNKDSRCGSGQEHEAEAIVLRGRSPVGLKLAFFRALQRALPFQPDAEASGFGWRYLNSLKSIMSRGGRSRQALIPGLVTGAALLEMLALPLPLQSLPEASPPPAWQIWLNESSSKPKIVLLPFAPGSKVEDFEQTTRWMWANRSFQGSMLNGYSGFFPADHSHVREELLKFPTAAGIKLLRAKGIEYVVIYHNLPAAPPAKAVRSFLPQVYWDQAGQVGLYQLRN